MKALSYLGWFLAVIFAVLVWRGCGNETILNPKTDDSLVNVLLKTHAKDSAEVAYWMDLSAFWQDRYDSLWGTFKDTKDQIRHSISKIKTLSDSVNFYKAQRDTLSALVQCGDLIEEDSMLIAQLGEANVQLDSVKIAGDQAIAYKDSIISSQATEIMEFIRVIGQLKVDYDDAVAKYNKGVKANKIDRIFARIGIVTAAILATILMVKK